eukprot:TRINITY_DN14121_c0_g1_i1.p2 TRINITY_DN14121_c0_g1~~TRINITY_DN14121_c0_g1_i1.p2  ORF type:complete len:100 (-),score=0.27 TRINITY_DN14121_c0_g1_i1:246-545(-)
MEKLPEEIRLCMVPFLDLKSRRALRLANAKWFTTIRYSNYIFKYKNEDELLEILQTLQKYNHPISITINNSRCVVDKQILQKNWTINSINEADIASQYF